MDASSSLSLRDGSSASSPVNVISGLFSSPLSSPLLSSPLPSPVLSSLSSETKRLRQTLQSKHASDTVEFQDAVTRLFDGLSNVYFLQRDELSRALLSAHTSVECAAAQAALSASQHNEEIAALTRELRHAMRDNAAKCEPDEAAGMLMQRLTAALQQVAMLQAAAGLNGFDATTTTSSATSTATAPQVTASEAGVANEPRLLSGLSGIVRAHSAELSAAKREMECLRRLAGQTGGISSLINQLAMRLDSAASDKQALTQRCEGIIAQLTALQSSVDEQHSLSATIASMPAALSGFVSQLSDLLDGIKYQQHTITDSAASFNDLMQCHAGTMDSWITQVGALDARVSALDEKHSDFLLQVDDRLKILDGNLDSARKMALSAVESAHAIENSCKAEVAAMVVHSAQLQEAARVSQAQLLEALATLEQHRTLEQQQQQQQQELSHDVLSQLQLPSPVCKTCSGLPLLQERVASLKAISAAAEDALSAEILRFAHQRTLQEAQLRDVRAQLEEEKLQRAGENEAHKQATNAFEERTAVLRQRVQELEQTIQRICGNVGGESPDAVLALVHRQSTILGAINECACTFLGNQHAKPLVTASLEDELRASRNAVDDIKRLVQLYSAERKGFAALGSSAAAEEVKDLRRAIHSMATAVQHSCDELNNCIQAVHNKHEGVTNGLQDTGANIRSLSTLPAEFADNVTQRLRALDHAMTAAAAELASAARDDTLRNNTEQLKRDFAALASTIKGLAVVTNEREAAWESQRREIMHELEGVESRKSASAQQFKETLEEVSTSWIALMLKIKESHDRHASSVEENILNLRKTVLQKERSVGLQLQALSSAASSLKESASLRNNMLHDEARLLEDMIATCTKQADDLLQQIGNEREQNAQQLDVLRNAMLAMIRNAADAAADNADTATPDAFSGKRARTTSTSLTASRVVSDDKPAPSGTPKREEVFGSNPFTSPLPIPDLRTLQAMLAQDNLALREALRSAQSTAAQRDAATSEVLKQLRTDYEKLRLSATPIINRRAFGAKEDAALPEPGPASSSGIVSLVKAAFDHVDSESPARQKPTVAQANSTTLRVAQYQDTSTDSSQVVSSVRATTLPSAHNQSIRAGQVAIETVLVSASQLPPHKRLGQALPR